MKKKLSYRDKLLELSKIYNVKEIQEYIKRRKNLTSGQIELILRKNKIIIPKDFNNSFFKENISKPFARVTKQIDNLKDNSSKKVSKVSRKIFYFKEDSSRSVSNLFYNSWKSIVSIKSGISDFFFKSMQIIWRTTGNAGLGFLNMIPKLGKTYYSFFSNFFIDLFNGIYNQQINKGRTGKAILSFFIVVGVTTIVISGISTFKSLNIFEKNEVTREVIKKEKIIKEPKKEVKKQIKEPKKEIKKKVQKPKTQEKKKNEKVAEIILPDLNLKTETVLNLFKDVNYDLNKVRYEKKVKPIYFTQFPKDLDEIQSVRLKKDTFIKIVLPLVVAENEKILEDRFKLKKIASKKMTSDNEKQWLRQKFLEYKVKKGSVEELKNRMDIIPTSIALAQAAKESGWGTSRFALEGNAIFGQWTWNGRGIEPLLKDKSKSHKILRFPILRASVKAYKNNLNTHKSYVKFRAKRKALREKNKKIDGLELTKTLSNYAETGSEYTKILAQIIVQNRLMDFEPVRLSNSGPKREFNL